MQKGRLIEIFTSLQGEGAWIGLPQIFVRFHGCRLKCTYCDTPLTHYKTKNSRVERIPFSQQFDEAPLEWTVQVLKETILKINVASLAITGGEPLEQVEFLAPFFKEMSATHKILLETSGIETRALTQVIGDIDLVSLDIKIPSATKERAYWKEHQEFLEVAQKKSHYMKVVYDESLQLEEIEALINLLENFPNTDMYMQPISPLRNRDMQKCIQHYFQLAQLFPNRIRFLPQMHKMASLL